MHRRNPDKKKIIHHIIYGEPNYDVRFLILMYIDDCDIHQINIVPARKVIMDYDELKRYRFQSFSSN
jgi:hypothetical protein